MTFMAEMPGSVVADRYRLVEAIGKGAMGRVWRAHDQLLDREVAVKEIYLPDGLAAEDRREIVDRAMREAQAAARLNHRGIVTVHDVLPHGGKPWIIMEMISGYSLDQAIAGTARLDWSKVAEIGAALADALAHAHAAGIVHRDLKPSNVMLSGSRVVITDFGIARILDASVRLTAPAAIIGTPQYMPPEQDVQGWIVWLLGRYSTAYVSNQFRALQQFFKWLAAEEEIPDPMAGLRPPHVPDKPVPVFADGELAGACLRGPVVPAAPRRRDDRRVHRDRDPAVGAGGPAVRPGRPAAQ